MIFGVFPLTYLRFSEVAFFTFYYQQETAIIVKNKSPEKSLLNFLLKGWLFPDLELSTVPNLVVSRSLMKRKS